jgi:hypothetical protein
MSETPRLITERDKIDKYLRNNESLTNGGEDLVRHFTAVKHMALYEISVLAKSKGSKRIIYK